MRRIVELVQGHSHDQCASHGSKFARQGQLAGKLVLMQLAAIDLATGRQNAQRNGQIKAPRVFGQVGWRQVHGDALVVGKLKA